MTMHSGADRFSRIYEQSRPAFEKVADRTRHMYQDAREWVPDHQGTLATVSALAVGACLLGYLIGRGGRPEPVPEQVARAAAATRGQLSELDIRPVFRFVSLWMLYRVATKD